MRATLCILAAAALVSSDAPAIGQSSPGAAPAAPTEPGDNALAGAPDTSTPAAHIRTLLDGYFHGQWRSTPDAPGSQPALLLRAAPISIHSVQDTALVEIARADSPADPFRVYIIQIYQRPSGLWLRQLELTGEPGLPHALAGLALAPAWIPTLEPEALTPVLDMPLVRKGAGFTGATEHPFPTARSGAVEMTASVAFGPDSIRIADTGLDAEGRQVWGQRDGASLEFVPLQPRPKPIAAGDGGIVIISLVNAPPGAPQLQPGGEVVIHYTSWLTSGRLLESSRAPGHEPARTRIPGNILPGLNKGLIGIAKGERRKIIIPSELAYGKEGRPPIPPDATLIFDVECLEVNNEPQPSGTIGVINPHAAPPGSVPRAPAPDSGGTIGAPPTNGGPESPRGGGH